MATSVIITFPADENGNDIDPIWIIEKTGEQIADEDVRGVDWKDPPVEVIRTVNLLLKKHNLDLEILEDGSDAYWFRIKPLT